MALDYEIVDDSKSVRITANGEVTLGMCLDTFKLIAQDPAHAADRICLIDFRKMRTDPAAADASALNGLLGVLRQHFRAPIALVVPRDGSMAQAAMLCGLARPYGVKMKAFDDLAEARKWLKLE
jgi:hypothetical protein